MVLIQKFLTTDLPVIAAGGIATGAQIAAAFALGAHAVQIGSRFAASEESRAHNHFKQAIIEAGPEDTRLCMKNLVPVRLLKNKFYQEVAALEEQGASSKSLQELLGKGRAKKGMHLGDLEAGELEIGQVSGLIHDSPSIKKIVTRLISEYNEALLKIPQSLN